MPETQPPFYEAAEDLYIGNPEVGAMPVAAFRAGDRVTPDLVEPNGWGDKVRVPDMFAPPPEPPAEPAAKTSKTGGKPAGKET